MKLVLFVVLSLQSNSDRETLLSSLCVGFSVTSPHVTQLLGQQQHLFRKCSLHLSLATTEAERHIKVEVYLPWAAVKRKCFNRYKKDKGKAFALEFHLEKQTSGMQPER